jgi:hypothetical protein
MDRLLTIINMVKACDTDFGRMTENPHDRPLFEKFLVKKGWLFFLFCCIIALWVYWIDVI